MAEAKKLGQGRRERAELDALRKNAERYLKLRDGAFASAPMVVDPFNPAVTYTGSGLDAALDALPTC